jgi:hypothetical protein
MGNNIKICLAVSGITVYDYMNLTTTQSRVLSQKSADLKLRDISPFTIFPHRELTLRLD